MTTLRHRCKAVLDKLQMDAILRQGDPVEDLVAFVQAEKGRAADERLKDTMPLILYFASERDREEFIALVREAKPNMTVKRMP
jgi:hypothetical protein